MDEILKQIGVDMDVAFALIFFSLVWVRCLAMAAVLPFLFGKPVPRYVMVAASMALAFYVALNIYPETPPPLAEEWGVLVLLYIKEAFYGFIMGFAIGIIFHAFASVGQMIDNQRGMSIARILIPSIGQQLSISSLFLFQLGIVLFLLIGGHLIFFRSFFESFVGLPVLAFPQVGPGLFPLIDLMIRLTGQVIFLGLQMAAPVIIAIFLADIILGLANRIAPQINVWMLGFTLKGYVGILLLFVSITMIAEQIERRGLEATEHTQEAIELLEGRVPVDAPQLPEPEEGMPRAEDGPPPVVNP